MSQSATPTTRNEATKRWKHPKTTPPAELTIGTAIRGSHERLRTAANGCERERNVERTHPQTPDPQSETGTLATHSGKNGKSYGGLLFETHSLHVFWHDGLKDPLKIRKASFESRSPDDSGSAISRGRKIYSLTP